MAEIPPRLHVLLARDAPVGVVIRRGPSKRVCTVLWDRSRDEFRLGQWLKGRIYERRSDLSPDGRHLIYFAMNGRWESEGLGSWSAVSRAPYLKAIAFHPKGDCWQGGGLFTGEGTYWLNDPFAPTESRDTGEVRRDPTPRPSGEFGHECLGVYYPRLLRDGWTLAARSIGDGGRHAFDVFEKPAGAGWILRKIAHAGVDHPPGKGCYWDEHELIHPGTGRALPRPRWEWAEVDGDRLVWAEGGKLLAATLGAGGPAGEAVLHDFGGMSFEPIRAPY